MHRLAIIIPFYKIDYFEETLESLRIQTNQNFNLYIGNDASPSDPLPLIEKYFKNRSYNYYNYPDNLGKINLSFQWARILENVNEEWFQILGDDDFLAPDFVAQFYNKLNSIDASINVVKVRSVMCDGESRILKQLYDGFASGLYNSVDLMIKKIGGRLNSSLSEHIFRLSTYRKIDFPEYELAWHTDDMLILKASNFRNILFIADTTVYVRIYEGSTSGSKGNTDVKEKASLVFYDDFSQLLINNNASWRQVRQYLKSLRNKKKSLGHNNLKRIYSNHGLIGRLYYESYLIKIFFKRFIPKTTINTLQKNG